MRMSVTEWLLDSDPSIRWQVMRDLIGESDASVAHERLRASSEGWGAPVWTGAPGDEARADGDRAAPDVRGTVVVAATRPSPKPE